MLALRPVSWLALWFLRTDALRAWLAAQVPVSNRSRELLVANTTSGGQPVEETPSDQPAWRSAGKIMDSRIRSSVLAPWNNHPKEALDASVRSVLPVLRQKPLCSYRKLYDSSLKKLAKYLPSKSLHEALGLGSSNGTAKARRCAVVSNSGLMLTSGQGQYIDGHDLVIRFNYCTTKGFERDVGRKTHIRIMGRNAVYWEGNETIVHRYNQEMYQTRDRSIMKKLNNSRTNRIYPVKSVFTLQTGRLRGVGGTPSSGFQGVALAINLCQKVHIFGFKPFRKGVPYHYWNDTLFKTTTWEAFNKTHRIPYQHLVSTALITPANLPHHMGSEWDVYRALERARALKVF